MRKEIRKQTNRTCGSLLVYYLIMTGIVMGAMFVKAVLTVIRAGDPQKAALALKTLESQMDGSLGVMSIAGVGAGLLFLYFVYRKRLRKEELFREERPMNSHRFLKMLCLLMACQAVFSSASILAELLLNPFGYTLQEAARTATETSGSISMVLYAGLAGPVAEELVFRGVVLRRLLPFGKGFAIVVSAVLFGVMHGNFLQGIYAFFAGLVFGYVTAEYSLRWSVLLHILNNLVFGDLVGRLSQMLPQAAGDGLQLGITAGFFLAALWILWKNRKQVRRWWQENRPPRVYWAYGFTTVWMLLFMLLNVAAAMNGVGKLQGM